MDCKKIKALAQALALEAGELQMRKFRKTLNIQWKGVTDPGDDLIRILTHEKGERIVVFEWNIVNFSGASQRVDASPAIYTVSVTGKDGKHRRDLDPVFVSVDNGAAPATLSSVSSATVQAVFVVPAEATPVQLQFSGGFAGVGGITYRFK